jgi:hypothetical protein
VEDEQTLFAAAAAPSAASSILDAVPVPKGEPNKGRNEPSARSWAPEKIKKKLPSTND